MFAEGTVQNQEDRQVFQGRFQRVERVGVLNGKWQLIPAGQTVEELERCLQDLVRKGGILRRHASEKERNSLKGV